MIKVLFDHQTFSTQKYGGISRYFANLHDHISKQSDISSDISIVSSENQYITKFPALLNNNLGDLIFQKPNRRLKWNKVYSKYRMRKQDYDILHPTYYLPYFLKYSNKPFVITVHDMIHELYPEYFTPYDRTALNKRLCIENAAHIVAISETTKRDLINILGVEENRISVIYHGFDPQLSAVSKDNKPHIDHDYLLFVGERRAYKNWSRFVSTLCPLLHQNPSLKLICAGGGPFLSAETELLSRLKISNQIVQMNVTDELLSQLYQRALMFVYPSLYEGFGYPILEAFQNGCPVAASDTPCFQEIGGDAIAYFNPFDQEDMLRVITSLLSNSLQSKQLTERGTEILPNYAMENCMERTLDVYRSLVH